MKCSITAALASRIRDAISRYRRYCYGQLFLAAHCMCYRAQKMDLTGAMSVTMHLTSFWLPPKIMCIYWEPTLYYI
jgi:hypothetical protein